MDNPENGGVVLDTHVFVWLMTGDSALANSSALSPVVKAASESKLLLSGISLWELAKLEQLGRIKVSIPFSDWLDQAIQTPGLCVTGITPHIGVDASRLPEPFAGDPVDRILAATARVRRATLVTADPLLIQYGTTGNLTVLAV